MTWSINISGWKDGDDEFSDEVIATLEDAAQSLRPHLERLRELGHTVSGTMGAGTDKLSITF